VGNVEITWQWQAEVKRTRHLCLDDFALARWVDFQRNLLLSRGLHGLLPRHDGARNQQFTSSFAQHFIGFGDRAFVAGMSNRSGGRNYRQWDVFGIDLVG